ncbi:hypothetical protein ACSAZL_12210 [Methanosarcina sp. T3]|uniref:hypothetical protein n=1 Tax=Methanosarcina sp. T3 TaxID=3439062 RepID=UPI003F87708A
MDITFFIFLSLIAFFLMFYGWHQDGVNFVFLILSSAIFIVLAFSSSEITWTYAIISNSTAIDYTVTQRSIVFARLYGLLSGLCFLMAFAKLAILAEENTRVDFSKIWEKITKGKV